MAKNKAVPAVYILLEKDGKYFFTRRFQTGYRDGWYQMPAGHVEEGEAPTAAAAREAEEEAGVKIDPRDLEFIHFSHRPKHDDTGDRVDIFFRAKKWAGEPHNAEAHKCDEVIWVDPANMPSNTVPHVRVAVECIRKGLVYNEVSLDFLNGNGYVK